MEIAARLNRRITIQLALKVADGAGGITVVWQDVASLWAEVNQRKPSESYFNSKLEIREFYIFTIRYRNGLDTKMRVRFGNRYFRITGIVNISEKNEVMEIYAEEIF